MLLLFMTIGPWTAQGRDIIGEPPPEPWILSLNAKCAVGELTCDFGPFEDVVEFYAQGGNPHVQQRILDWLATFDQRLPLGTARVAYRALLENAGNQWALDKAREQLALVELAHTSLDVRRKTYLAAITSNFTRLPNGAAMNWVQALEQSAYDGLAEAAPALEKMEKTENLKAPFASVMLSYLRSRSGAFDRDDARRVHLERLLAMPIADFHLAMVESQVFRLSTIGTVDDTCYRARSHHCNLARDLFGRWESWLDQIPGANQLELSKVGMQPSKLGDVRAYFRRLVNGMSG